MTTLLLTVMVVLLVVAAMSIGIIFGRQPIKGSCGGMSAMAGDTSCAVCGGNPEKCPEGDAEGRLTRAPEIFDPKRSR
jgi:uncharacterized protein